MELFTWNTRDALMLAITELESYGITTRTSAPGTEAEVRAELAAELTARAPHGLGSYAFWLRADTHRFAHGGIPPLHTSGHEVDVALAAAVEHQGLYPAPGRNRHAEL